MHGLAGGETLAVGREHRRVRPNFRMTRHARFSGWDSCEGRLFDGRVAVSAIQPQTRHMMFVTERNFLLARNKLVGGVRRPINQIDDAPKADETAGTRAQKPAKKAVAAFAENLIHRFSPSHSARCDHNIFDSFLHFPPFRQLDRNSLPENPIKNASRTHARV